MNLPLAAQFIKSYSADFLSDDPDPFISAETLQSVRSKLVEYYEALSKTITRAHKQLRNMEKQNREYTMTKGELPEDRQEKFDNATKLFEKWQAAAVVLAPALKLPEPVIEIEPEEEEMIDFISKGVEFERQEGDLGCWEDEETKVFYDEVNDLRNYVPFALLGIKASSDAAEEEEKKEETDESELLEKEEEELEDELDEVSAAEPMENVDQDGVEEAKEEDDEEKKEDGKGLISLSTSTQASLDALFSRMLHALNREAIDQIAVDFAYLNSKGARKKLVQALLGVPRLRHDLLPYYSRLIATLSKYFPDIKTMVIETVPLFLLTMIRAYKLAGKRFPILYPQEFADLHRRPRQEHQIHWRADKVPRRAVLCDFPVLEQIIDIVWNHEYRGALCHAGYLRSILGQEQSHK